MVAPRPRGRGVDPRRRTGAGGGRPGGGSHGRRASQGQHRHDAPRVDVPDGRARSARRSAAELASRGRPACSRISRPPTRSIRRRRVRQRERFAAAVEALAAAGVRPPHVHLANSAAVLSEPAAHFTMVRPGLMLYGYAPAPHLATRARCGRPCACGPRSRRCAACRPARRSATAARASRRAPSTIATLPIGYADGYHRARLEPRRDAGARAPRVPIAGRVCMDHSCST